MNLLYELIGIDSIPYSRLNEEDLTDFNSWRLGNIHFSCFLYFDFLAEKSYDKFV
jgi:hypothetical protein